MAGPAQLTRGVSQLFLLLTQVSGCRDQQLRRVVTFLCRLNTVSEGCRTSPLVFFDRKKNLTKKNILDSSRGIGDFEDGP